MDIEHVKEIQTQRRKQQEEKKKKDPNSIWKTQQYSSIIIESSKYKGKLLKRKEIISKLAYSFKAGHNTFIFSGHGVPKGAMVIQTQQNEEGQLFTIEELLQIFLQNRQSKESLNIFLDCCFAGKMAIHLKSCDIPEDVSIRIYCSSGPNQISSDLNNYGGLLVCWLWAKTVGDKFLMEYEKTFLAKAFSRNNPFRLTYQRSQQSDQKRWNQVQPLQWKSILFVRQPHSNDCQLI